VEDGGRRGVTPNTGECTDLVEPTSACGTGENRWTVNTIKYLFDVYDTNNDYTADTIQQDYVTFFDNNNRFVVGSANHQRDEPWSGTTVVDGDGKSARDFDEMWWTGLSVNTYSLWVTNCQVIGD